MNEAFKKTILTSAAVHFSLLIILLIFSALTFKIPEKVKVYNVKLVELAEVKKTAASSVVNVPRKLIKKEQKPAIKKPVQKEVKAILEKPPVRKDIPKPEPVRKPAQATSKPKTETSAARKSEDIKPRTETGTILEKAEHISERLPEWYIELIQERIYRLWQCPPGADAKEAVVCFEIQRDGVILNPFIEKTSGVMLFDESALTTVGNIGKLYPFPDGFKGDKLTVHFTFRREG